MVDLLYDRRITALPHPPIEEDEWSDPTFNEDASEVLKTKEKEFTGDVFGRQVKGKIHHR